MSDFSLDACIVGGRWRHHRTRDHFGSESDLYVSIVQDVGPFIEGTPIHYVLLDLAARITALESGIHSVSSFSLDARIGDAFILRAVIFRPALSSSFTFSAWKTSGGSFGLAAIIRGGGNFTLRAVLT